MAAASGAQPALALPDLVPEVFDLNVEVGDVLQADVDEGCAGGAFNRRLVKFSIRTHNIGADDLIMGNPGCPNCSLNPGAPCSNPLFVCGTSHGHAHFESFAKNEILDQDDNIVAEGRKYGFCLLDMNCPNPHYSCSFQGITAGCSDLYSAGLPCQYVDITDTPLGDGQYKLRVRLDPENLLAESDDSNNVLVLPFTIGQTPQICPTYASTDVPKAIPDSGPVASSVTVPDLGPVTSLRLRMAGTHTYLGDLAATLTSPASTTRTLFSQVCGLADDFDVYLGDDAVDPFVCPATDPSVLRQAAESFSSFHGEGAGGDWTLTINDLQPNHAGSLNAWSLEICSICGNGLIDAGEACDDGNISDSDCCSADCQLAASDGASCEDGNACTINETCSSGSCVEGGSLECDPCLVCDSAQGCVVPDLVYPCQEPPSDGSLIKIRHYDSEPDSDTLLWKWVSQTPVELDELGAPEILTAVSLCIYEGSNLLLSSTIPAASSCAGGAPCWVREEHDATFLDRSAQFGGMATIRFKEGSKGKILVRGHGNGLAIPGLYPSLPTTVRLRRSDGTPCWEANFDSSRTSTENLFKARSR